MKLSYAQLKSAIATYVDENKISVDNFIVTANNTIGLLDAIGKIYTIPSTFVDKLAIFDGEELSYGKTIEEWKADLILPEDYNGSGSNALAPHRSTFRPVSFSFTLVR